MRKIRIYLDNCCFNRPYDNQKYLTIQLETEAKIFIQKKIESNELEVVWSFMLDLENEANPHQEEKQAIAEWKDKADEYIPVKNNIRSIAKTLEQTYHVKPKDALHVACAVESNCDFFVSTDRYLLKKLSNFTDVNCINPIHFIEILEGKDEI